MKQKETYVGIDVAKARVDVAIRPDGDVWSVDYDESGVRELVSVLELWNRRRCCLRLLVALKSRWCRLLPRRHYQCVKGGAMKDHRGGEKLYHLAPLFSINVRANC